MATYSIAEDNHVHPVAEGTAEGDATFASAEELEQVTAEWPLRRLVTVWNQLPGVCPVARFENRRVALQRIWRALQAPSTEALQQRRRGKAKRSRRESKVDLVLKMLRSSEGATLKALMKATRWQAHSVRGFLSAKVAKQLALPLASFRRDGERVYRLPAAQ